MSKLRGFWLLLGLALVAGCGREAATEGAGKGEAAAPQAVAVAYYKAFWLHQDPEKAWELEAPYIQAETTREQYLENARHPNYKPRPTPPLRVEAHKLTRDEWIFVIHATNNDERPYLVQVKRYEVGWRVDESRIYKGEPIQ